MSNLESAEALNEKTNEMRSQSSMFNKQVGGEQKRLETPGNAQKCI